MPYPLKGLRRIAPGFVHAWNLRALDTRAPCGVRGLSDLPEILRDVFRKYPRSGDKDVRARLCGERRRVGLDASVNLERDGQFLRVDDRPCLANFRQDVLAEGLAREPRMDRHDEEQIDAIHEWLCLLEWRRRVQDKTRTH